MDDYSALRGLNGKMLEQEGALLASSGARAYEELRHVTAAGNFTTPNPPPGAVLTYYLRKHLPDGDATRVVLAIEDSKGEPVRRLAGAKSAGLHRLVWDLRREKSRREGRRRRPGPMVAPGKYKVTLMKISGDATTVLGQPQTVLVKRMKE